MGRIHWNDQKCKWLSLSTGWKYRVVQYFILTAVWCSFRKYHWEVCSITNATSTGQNVISWFQCFKFKNEAVPRLIWDWKLPQWKQKEHNFDDLKRLFYPVAHFFTNLKNRPNWMRAQNMGFGFLKFSHHTLDMQSCSTHHLKELDELIQKSTIKWGDPWWMRLLASQMWDFDPRDFQLENDPVPRLKLSWNTL